MLKYLRIAVTVLSLMACVLLIVLWMRSTSALESWQQHVAGKWSIHVQSARGKLVVFTIPHSALPKFASMLDIGKWGHSNIPIRYINPNRELVTAIGGSENSTAYFGESRRICVIPISFMVLFMAAIAVCPWIPWSRRFSLRTLLIATTLVTFGLGVVVYQVR